MATVFVLDTSYLCEFYRLPGRHRNEFSAKIGQRMREQPTGRFVLPLGCRYQLCDHIGDISDGHKRRDLANAVVSDTKASLDDGLPWLIVPVADVKYELPRLLRAFSEDPVRLQMGLTDSTIVSEANRLKRKYGASLDYRVHIWTTDVKLKGYEPDSEPDPLL
ncbi:hypothetical protein [Candidatus Palauibacter sp.]|uniref:hypothetical protein n=1 Tax=Candidatus Palauibacter sp. TaxID=3101350 RepID=UPI003B5AB3B0